jgi:ABC-type proline/glycine betaine transport system ATPase subunit
MISTEYIVAPLMTAVSHLMGRAEVHALGTYENGIAMASFIIGDVGSGKTTALSMIQGCLEKIDDALFIDQLERKSLNGN